MHDITKKQKNMEYIKTRKELTETKNFTEKKYSEKDLPRLKEIIKDYNRESCGTDLSMLNDEMLDLITSTNISLDFQSNLDRIKSFYEETFEGCNFIFQKRNKLDDSHALDSSHYDVSEGIISINDVDDFFITNKIIDISCEDFGDFIKIFNEKNKDIIFTYSFTQYSAKYIECYDTMFQNSLIRYNLKNNYHTNIMKSDFGNDGKEKRYIPFLDKTLNFWGLKRELKKRVRREKVNKILS